MIKIQFLSNLAEVAYACSFQLGRVCSFAQVEGPFPIFRLCNLKCILSKMTWTVAAQSQFVN